jgi:hypothetical protein
MKITSDRSFNPGSEGQIGEPRAYGMRTAMSAASQVKALRSRLVVL